MTNEQPLSERVDSILVALRQDGSIMSSDDLWEVVGPFFRSRKDFGRALAALTKKRAVFVKYNNRGDGAYSLDPRNGDDATKLKKERDGATKLKTERGGATRSIGTPMAICDLYTQDAARFVAAIQATAARPYVSNSKD